MVRDNLTRVEFQLRTDDAELLARLAALRGCSMAELVRRSLYESLEPLARAQKEREMRTAQEVNERRRMREWEGIDPVKAHEKRLDDAIRGGDTT